MKLRSLITVFILSVISLFSNAQSTATLCRGSNLCVQGYPDGIWNGPGVVNYSATCITPTASGTYSCQTSGPLLTYSVVLLDKPSVSFLTLSPAACVPEFTFNGSSSISSGSINAYEWTFGDNSSDLTFPSVIHDYNAPGIYTVTLKAYASNGCSDSLARTVTVSPAPNLSFYSTSSCPGTAAQMINTSTISAPGSISSYTWDLGNSNSSSATNPATTYTASGVYTVSLYATTASGCTTSIAQTLTIFPLPQISFTNSGFCSRRLISFTPTVSAASGSVSSYLWQFYNQSSSLIYSSTLAIPSFTFPPGNYTDILSIVSEHGCFWADTQNVLINPTPSQTIFAHAQDLCSLTYSFAFTGTGDSYSWNYDGTTTGTVNDTVFTYAGPGTYTASLIGVSNAGCTSTTRDVITISPPPSVSFTLSSTCLNSTFSITAAPSASITSHSWDFGDPASGAANTSTLWSPSHTYTASTAYSVTLNMTNSLSCNVQTVMTITIFPQPVITVSSGSICSGQSFSVNPGGAATYTYLNGSAVVTPTATSHYSVTGTSSAGCVASIPAVSSVTVNTTPTISPLNGTLCAGNTFTLNGNGAPAYVLQNGSSTVSPVSTSTYVIYGLSAQGCLSANSGTTTITVNPVPTISVNSGTICAGKEFTIVPVATSTYAISGGTNVVSPATNTFYIATATNSYGCSSSAISNLYVLITPTVTVNSGTICSGTTFTLNPSGGLTYTFSGGTATVTPATSTNYTVTGIGASGCTNAAVSALTVYITPTITVNSGTICSGKSFTMAPAGAASYSYANGSAVISPPASTVISVTGISPFGCNSSVSSSITVFTTPTVTINSSTLCQGQSFTLSPSGANSYVFSGGNAVVSPTSNTSYTVTGISVQGCTAEAVSSLTVFVAPHVSVNSGSICEGESFTLVPNGAVNYTFSGGSAVVSPTATTAYTVTGTNAQGCQNLNTAVSTITVGNVPVLQVLSTNSAMCAGETSTLLAMGAASYTWTGHTPASFIFITPTVTTEYTVTGKSSTGCFQTMVYTQTVSACTGIDHVTAAHVSLLVYPNPNNGMCTLKSEQPLDLKLINALGQSIRTVSLKESTNFTFELNDLANGVYYLISEDTRTSFTQKIIVTR